MCETKVKKKPIEKAKEDLQKSKEKLNQSLCEGEDRLCDFISHLWDRGHANKTSAEGK